jgi:hypothetical protein
LRAKGICLEEKGAEPDVVVYWLNDLRRLCTSLMHLRAVMIARGGEEEERRRAAEENWGTVLCISFGLWKPTRKGLEKPSSKTPEASDKGYT